MGVETPFSEEDRAQENVTKTLFLVDLKDVSRCVLLV